VIPEEACVKSKFLFSREALVQPDVLLEHDEIGFTVLAEIVHDVELLVWARAPEEISREDTDFHSSFQDVRT
jgi:hypothetical protein